VKANELLSGVDQLENTATTADLGYDGPDANLADNQAAVTTPVFLGDLNDYDGDGIPNQADRDDDNDGIPDSKDPDRDGDGVDNSLDIAPDDPSRLGPYAVGLLDQLPLSVKRLRIRFNFTTAGRDSIMLRGWSPAPAGFEAAGSQVDIVIGGLTKSFVLDQRGRGVADDGTVKLKVGTTRYPDWTYGANWTLRCRRGNYTIADTDGRVLDGSKPGLEARIIRFDMTLRQTDGTVHRMFNAKTVGYKSSETKGIVTHRVP
jgi:hypothetical protein